MKRRTVILLCVVAGLAIAVPLSMLVAPAIIPFVAMHISFEEIEAEEHEMQQPGYYQPVAKDLALFCQTYGSAFQDAKIAEVEKAWLPDSAQKLKFRSCYIGPDYLSLEYGGGFHHFGYNVELDKGASNPRERVWRFSFYSEDKNNDNPIELTTIRLPTTATCSDFIRTALGHYGQEVSEFPKVLSIYQFELKDDPLFSDNFSAWTQDVSVYLYHSGYRDLAVNVCRKVQLKLNDSRDQLDLSWLKTFQGLETAFSGGSAAKDSAPERSELTKMIFLTNDLFQSAPEGLRELGGER